MKRKASGKLKIVEQRGEHRGPMEPTRKAEPGMTCAPHLAHAGIRKAAYIVILGQGFCRDCFMGKAARPEEERLVVMEFLSARSREVKNPSPPILATL